MKNLFKLFITLCLLLTMPLSTAFASNSDWKDPDYNFSKIETIKLTDIIIELPSISRFDPDVAIRNRVKYALKSALQKRHINLYTKDVVITNKIKGDEGAPTQTDIKTNTVNPLTTKGKTLAEIRAESAPLLTVKIHNLGTSSVYHKAWNEYYTYNRRITREVSYRDSKGHKRYRDEVITIPERRTRHHDAYTSTTSYADLSFFLENPKDGNEVVFTIHDSRSREFTDDTTGMLRRICELFAKKVSR